MPPLNKDVLSQKLRNLNSSQQAIEGIASWCLFYKSDAKQVVNVWESEFASAPPPLKLSLLYVANHLLQESRKKGREFSEEFNRALPKAMKHAYKTGDEKLKKSVIRLLDIWDERKVFGSSHIKAMKETILSERSHSHHSSGRAHATKEPAVPPALVPLAETIQHVEQAHQRTQDAMAKSVKGIRQGLVQDGSPAELHAALELLSQYGSALEAEIEGRQRGITLLRTLIRQQEEEVARSTDNLNLCKIQRENVERRLALVSGSGGGMGLPPSAGPLAPSMPPPMPRPPFTPSPPAGAPFGSPGFSPYYNTPAGVPPHPSPRMPLPPTAPPTGVPPRPMGNLTNGSGLTPPPHHSPAAPRPDSPMPPPMSPADSPGTTAAAPAPAPTAPVDIPLLDADMLASLAEKLANSEQSATLLAQALESLPADERAHLSVNVSQVLAGGGAGDDDAGAGGEGEGTPVAPALEEEDDAPYDPEHPD